MTFRSQIQASFTTISPPDTRFRSGTNGAPRTRVPLGAPAADERPASGTATRTSGKGAVAFAAALATLLGTALAHAEDDRPSEDFAGVAPSNALELSLGNGFSQGFGTASSRMQSLGDLTRGGMSTQLGVGYRLSPRLMLGVYGEGARYFAASGMPDGTVGYGAAFGVNAQWHFMPFSRIDPWVGLGTGFRGYWVDLPNAGHHALHGFDVVRLRVGADYKLGPSTSVGPMLGATLTTFATQRDLATDDTVSTKNPELTAFVFAGIQGRFAIGGERVSASPRTVASR